MSEAIEVTDRYKAMGIPYPDPATVCKGQCEGTGLVPIYHSIGVAKEGEARPVDETDQRYLPLWESEHRKCAWHQKAWRFFRFNMVWRYGLRTHLGVIFNKCDGWHFVKCPDCGGKGKRV